MGKRDSGPKYRDTAVLRVGMRVQFILDYAEGKRIIKEGVVEEIRDRSYAWVRCESVRERADGTRATYRAQLDIYRLLDILPDR